MTKSISWREFEAELLGLYSPTRRAAKTRSKMAQVLREVGTLAATTGDLTPANVGRWVDSFPDRAAITTNGMLSYLRKACRYAIARGYLNSSPFEAFSFRLRVPKASRKRHLSRPQVATLLSHLEAKKGTWNGGRLYALTTLLCHTGLRAMEALRLKVEDVDFDTGSLDVVARFRLKTEGSEATIPVPPACLAVLREWSSRCGSEWLFPSHRRKKPWVNGSSGKRPTDFLKLAAVEAGLPPVTMLTLRHTLATHARTHFGLSSKTTQQILRHTVASTQDHYIGEDWDHLRSSVARIDFFAATRPIPEPIAG